MTVDTRAGARLRLRIAAYTEPAAVALVGAVQAVYLQRYGDTDITPVDPAEFAPPGGCFLVGDVDGVAVACGGWRLRRAGADPALRDGDIEVKRMYVADGMRGRGFARLLLAELERRAVEAGGRRVVLETGTRQPEAIALYRSSGYRPMTTFGAYRDDPLSRCFAKSLV
ncbi:MAG TPA: GNAT family N-acetyltransferase [Pseudonocardia sp.]|jgi:GNAT superfamily N-acetyltransferase